MTDVINYTAKDFKKYALAEAKNYIRRIQEIIEALDQKYGFDGEDSEDLACLFENAVAIYLHRAAFFDDHHRADAHYRWAIYSDTENQSEFEEMIGDQDTYDDGRAVSTTVRYGEGKDETVKHVWHPDPQHPTNQPGAVIDFSQGPYPFRYRYVTVVAPGVLSEVRKEEETGEEL
jgi:hypothetical protein